MKRKTYLGMPITLCIQSRLSTQFVKLMHNGRKPFYNLSRQGMHNWIRRRIKRLCPEVVICKVHIPAFTLDIEGRSVHAIVYTLRPIYLNALRTKGDSEVEGV